MTRSEKPWRPRRLLLTLLDESDATLVCAQTVVMARALEAEVSGVLVEESALFELAALQICAEIGAVTGRFRHMDEEALIARAQRRAALFRRELEALQETLGRPVPPLRVL